MATVALEFLRNCRVNPNPFFSNCECCRRNFAAFKVILMREQLKAQMPNADPGEDAILIFSRPETLSCTDCEDLKLSFDKLLHSMYKIRKDHEGFIQLMCKPEAGLYLLKGTDVLNHFSTKEQQVVIDQLRVT